MVLQAIPSLHLQPTISITGLVAYIALILFVRDTSCGVTGHTIIALATYNHNNKDHSAQCPCLDHANDTGTGFLGGITQCWVPCYSGTCSLQ